MDVIKEIHAFKEMIQERYDELNELKSNCDLLEQDILHYIEFERYDAPTGSRLLKKLKEVRVQRRQIKDEYEALQSVLKRMHNAGLTNFKRPEKNYTYRRVAIEGIFNQEEDHQVNLQLSS